MIKLDPSYIAEREEKRALIKGLRGALELAHEIDRAADKIIEATYQAFPQKVAA